MSNQIKSRNNIATFPIFLKFEKSLYCFEILFNGEHSPKFTQQVSLEYQRWLAERFIIA